MLEKFSILKFLEGKNYYGYDKHLHVFISTLLVIIFSAQVKVLMAGLISLLFGLLKESFDKFYRHENFDFKDILADVFGVVLGIIIVFLVKN